MASALSGMTKQFMHSPLMRRVSARSDIIFAVGVILIIGLLIIPLPAFLLDFLLATNITLAILILVVGLYINHPLELSIFPSMLLILTMFRLALNVSTTRLILGSGYAGEIIQSFGTFVIGGNYVVGLLIFIILVVIQFVVIIKGSSRISEVSARFTLDAMPGKQMSVDADLNAGIITEAEAKERRARIQREAEFYGAMDGATKFVRGDAIAGLVILGINIVGGFIIGIAQRGLSFQESLAVYTILTIGDGLVTQVPALIIAVSAGLIVTRTGAGGQIDREYRDQMFGNSRSLLVASGTLVVFALIPGLPTLPFLALGSLAGVIGYIRLQEEKEPKAAAPAAPGAAPGALKEAEDKVENYLQVDPVELEIGYALISLVDEARGGDLFNRITSLRKNLALELGIVIPPVRVRDNLQLEPNQYVIKIRGNVVSSGQLMMDRLLAMNPGYVTEEIEGIVTTEPAFGLPAKWVPLTVKEHAEILGYTVVEPAAVLSTHLQEVLKSNADKILGRQETKKLIENLKKDYPAVVEELSPETVPIGTVQKVLQNLLREGIPIRDLVTILESLMDYAKVTKNIEVLTEYVRHSLAETIHRIFADDKGLLRSIAMDPMFEQALVTALQNQRDTSPSLGLSPQAIEELNRSMKANVDIANAAGVRPVVMCAATVRPYFYRLIHTTFPFVSVLSFTEIPPEAEIEFIGTLEVKNAY
jgi:flagellar biosynthesis protein FlhA